MAKLLSAIDLSDRLLQEVVQIGDYCIDGTAGKGHETLKMARQVGPRGHLFAFDIQPTALVATQARLADQPDIATVTYYLAGHEQMAEILAAYQGQIKFINFNLGYLPGGDHRIATKGETTRQAIAGGLALLQPGGAISLVIYHGGDSGYDERDEVLGYLASLDHREYTVLVMQFANRPHDPPIHVAIYKHGAFVKNEN